MPENCEMYRTGPMRTCASITRPVIMQFFSIYLWTPVPTNQATEEMADVVTLTAMINKLSWTDKMGIEQKWRRQRMSLLVTAWWVCMSWYMDDKKLFELFCWSQKKCGDLQSESKLSCFSLLTLCKINGFSPRSPKYDHDVTRLFEQQQSWWTAANF